MSRYGLVQFERYARFRSLHIQIASRFIIIVCQYDKVCIGLVKILLAEDHVLVREGLRLFLSSEPDFEVVAETGDGIAVEHLVQTLHPDLLLLDLDLPGCYGTEVAAHIKAQFIAVKIVVLTGNLQVESARQALAAGAEAYVLKHADSTELLHAIRTVLAGGQYISKSIANMFQNEPPVMLEATRATASITSREQEILRLIARGLTNEEIATRLSRSVLTVRKHRQNLMEKLGLHNTAEIIAYAIKHGLYET